jgi:tetratricopeptide (TPR) repeat protein
LPRTTYRVLDPLSLIIKADLAELLLIAHSYDESIRQSRKTIEMDPNFALAHNQLGQAYLQKQMNEDAITELQKAVQLSAGSPTCLANLARAYAASGKRSEAVKLLSDLKKRSNPGYSHAPEIAVIYAALGEKNQATTWLEKGYEERFNPGVLLRPCFDPSALNRSSRSLCAASVSVTEQAFGFTGLARGCHNIRSRKADNSYRCVGWLCRRFNITG